MGSNNKELWEGRYSRGESINRYPYDRVVGFVLKKFGMLEHNRVRILDYGAGGGNNTLFLAQEGYDYYAVDYSETAVGIIAQHLRQNGFEPGKDRLFCGDFSGLPFPDAFFDLVVDRQALDQNSGSVLPEMVREIRRVLKPGGFYYGINFADRHPMLKSGRHLGGNDYVDFTKGPFCNGGLRHFFSTGEIMTLFADFEIEDIQFCQVRSVFDTESGSDEVLIAARRPVN